MKSFKFTAALLILTSLNCFAEQNDMKINIPENLRALLETSLRAPSSHNAQMWKIRFSEPMTIEIVIDRDKILPEVDPVNREAYISIGALVENIVSASAEYSLKANIEENANESAIIKIRFEEIQQAGETGIVKLINKRSTVRGKFSGKALSGEDIQYLCETKPGLIKYYPADTDTGKEIADLTMKASGIQTGNNNKQKELSEWFRFSKKDSREKKDGITPEMMGFKGIIKDFIYLIFNDETAMKKSFKKSTAKITEKQVKNCAGFFIIRSRDSDKNELLETGRVLQRIWLRAVEKDIAFHPMSQAIEEKETNTLLYELTGKRDEIQMIIRSGYIEKYPDPVSRRKPLDDILIFQ